MKPNMIALSLLIILISACHKSPTLMEKVVSYPAKTRSGQKYVKSNTDLSQIAWWKKLNDPGLNRLILQALACNNEIKSANAAILEAQAQLKSAQYAWLPTLDGGIRGFSGGTWDKETSGPLTRSPLFPTQSNFKFRGYSAGFVPNYSVNIFNNVYNVKSSGALLAIKEAQAQSTKLGIISQVSGAYFMLLSERTQLQLEKNLIKDLKELRQLEKIRYNKGASDIERMTSLDQELAQEETKIPQIEAVVAKNENAIHVLLNQNPGPIRTLHSLLSLNTDRIIPKSLPSSVLKHRPDIMIALNNIQVANAQIGVAYAAFFPAISLTSMVGGISADLTNLLKLNSPFWIAQAVASMKVWNVSAYQNIKAAKAKYYENYFNYLQTLRSAFADVDDNLTNEQKNRIAYLHTKRGYVAAKRMHTIVSNQYHAGAKDYRDVVNAKISVDRYALTLVQQKAQLLDSIVQVYTAVAGGYNAA